MKKIVVSFFILASVTLTFSQTKRIAHLSHSGMGYFFLDEFDDNLGMPMKMSFETMKLPMITISSEDTVKKISDTSVVFISHFMPDNTYYHDTVFNPEDMNDEAYFVDSIKRMFGGKVIFNGFDTTLKYMKPKDHAREGSNNHGDHGPQYPGDGMAFPASPSDGPNVNGIMILSLSISTGMALLAFLVYENVRRKSVNLILDGNE